MLDPSEIDNKLFTVRLRGYDPQEVDDFLDKVKAEYVAALGELAKYRSNPTAPIPQVSAGVTSAVADVSRILGVAQQAADQQVADAKVKAGGLVAQAQAEAAKLLDDAAKKAEEVTNAAKVAANDIAAAANAERAKVVGELELKRSDLQNKVDNLMTVHRETTSKLKDALQRLGEVAQ
jgi:DivIVA domain-containing protein